MARAAAISVENNFSKGHVTEFTGLNFPENVVTDSDNCIFTEEGRISRRYGFDREADYETLTADPEGAALSTYVWESVSGVGSQTIVVQQIGEILKLYLQNDTSLSSGYLAAGEVDLSFLTVAGNPSPAPLECQYSSGFGKLVVTHPYCEPFYVEYDNETGTVTATIITLRVRDLKGIDDGETPRQALLSDSHHYNLLNQGWAFNPSVSDPTLIDALINRFKIETGNYPGDTDVWWLYKNANEQFVPGALQYSVHRGNSPAPKGFYVLNAFYEDRSAASPVNNLPVTTSGGARPSCTAWFAGRAWYAGVAHKDYASKIYFSKIIENENEFGKCYQINDPTSEISSDFLPSDGGVIVIPDAGEVYRLWSLENSLLVFASNGIWSINGSQGIGFTATDYSVEKLSGIRSSTTGGFVDASGTPIWWASEGIYTIGSAQGGRASIQSLTDANFATFIEDIPDTCKKYARGAYSPIERRVIWVYRSTEPSSVANRYEFDRCLLLNVKTGAFNYWTMNDAAIVSGIVAVGGSTMTEVAGQTVVDNNGATVTDSLGATVTASAFDIRANPYVFKYLIRYASGANWLWTWAETTDTDYIDWAWTGNTEPAAAFFETGYAVRGEAQKKFQSNYVLVYADIDGNEVSVYFQGVWDYATTDLNRKSTKQTITYPTSGYKYAVRRIKVRGHGKALQFRVESNESYDLELIGWTVFNTGNGML